MSPRPLLEWRKRFIAPEHGRALHPVRLLPVKATFTAAVPIGRCALHFTLQ